MLRLFLLWSGIIALLVFGYVVFAVGSKPGMETGLLFVVLVAVILLDISGALYNTRAWWYTVCYKHYHNEAPNYPYLDWWHYLALGLAGNFVVGIEWIHGVFISTRDRAKKNQPF